jgi:hypothetical protein
LRRMQLIDGQGRLQQPAPTIPLLTSAQDLTEAT